MGIPRRDVIGTLLAGVIGTAFEAKRLLWEPAGLPHLPLLAPAAFVTMEDITREALRRLVRRVRSPVVLLPRDHRGEAFNGLGLTHLVGVALGVDLPSTVGQGGLDPEQYLEPAMANLAELLNDLKPRGCGQLWLPVACSVAARMTDRPSGLSLRGIFDYIHTKEGELIPTLRFDLLVAV